MWIEILDHKISFVEKVESESNRKSCGFEGLEAANIDSEKVLEWKSEFF